MGIIIPIPLTRGSVTAATDCGGAPSRCRNRC